MATCGAVASGARARNHPMQGLHRLKTRLLIGGIAGLASVAVFLAGWLDSLENIAVDACLRLRPARAIADEVRLVGIGDRDVGSQLGRWPFARAVHADVLDILAALSVRHTTFDVIFAEPSSDADQDGRLKAAITKHKATTLAYYFEEAGHERGGDAGRHFLEGNRYGLDLARQHLISGRNPQPPFAQLDTSFGAVNAVPDADGIIRRVPLFFEHGGRLYPSLAMQTIIAVLGLRADQISVVPGKEVTLVDTPRGTLHIPIDSDGQYRVNYAGDLGVFVPAFQYLDLYGAVQSPEMGKKVAAALKDSIAMIGIVSTGNSDMVNTSVGRVPGVAVQATVVSNILTGSHLRFLPWYAQGLLVIVFGMLLALIMLPARPWAGIGIFVLVVAAWSWAVLVAAGHDWMLPATPVLAAAGATMLLLTGLDATVLKRDRSRIVAVLGRYFARPLLARLIEHGDAALAKSERRELTIFFSDIRGFTSWTERAEPDEVTKRLNEYFSAMMPLVEKHGGTLDKIIGDCIMVFFGAPVAMDDHALRAVRMACEMQREMARLNTKWEREGRAPLHIGIGIHTGYVTVGNFGSEAFLDYTVIGRGVNLAARIEASAEGGKILVSERTNALVRDHIQTQSHPDLMLKGIPEPQGVFEVVG